MEAWSEFAGGPGATFALGLLGWGLAVAQFVVGRVEAAKRAKREEQHRRAERFRDERLDAYSAFLAAAWGSYYQLERQRRGASHEPPAEPNDVWSYLTPLTGNIHLLAPKPLGAKAQGAIAELFNLALGIDGGEPDLGRVD